MDHEAVVAPVVICLVGFTVTDAVKTTRATATDTKKTIQMKPLMLSIEMIFLLFTTLGRYTITI